MIENYKIRGGAAQNTAGLFNAASLQQKKEPDFIYKRLIDAGYPFTGFAGHGVSKPLYPDDPNGNRLPDSGNQYPELNSNHFVYLFEKHFAI